MERLTPASLLAHLDTFDTAIPLDDLTQALEHFDISDDELAPFLIFDESAYQRVMFHQGLHYEALILCWDANQRSDIHDHRGSSCAVKVLRGAATETTYERDDDGRVYATEVRTLPEGGVCSSVDLDTHVIQNEQSDGAHVSPPDGGYCYTPRMLYDDNSSVFQDTSRSFSKTSLTCTCTIQ